MKKNILYSLSLVVFLFLISGNSTHAATTTSTCTIDRSRLDWRIDTSTGADTVKHCVVQKFDTALGVLTSVELTASADTDTQQKVENKDVSPHTMTSKVTVELDVLKTDNAGLLEVSVPTSNESFSASAFDNTLDYDGTSGKTFDVQTGQGSKSITLTDEQDLALFSGTGGYDFPVQAEALWNCSGSGNAACEVDTYAAAVIVVTYTYTPPMPDLLFNSCSETSFGEGETGDYIITSSNQGNATTTSTIKITDTLPECLEYVDRDHGAWVCGYDQGTRTATCTFNGTVPPSAYLPELPMSVRANQCTATSLNHVVRVFVDREEKVQNNSLSCAVTITQEPVIPTPVVTETVLSEEVTPTPQPVVLPDEDEASVLAATGMKLLTPVIIGGLIIGMTLMLKRKKTQELPVKDQNTPPFSR